MIGIREGAADGWRGSWQRLQGRPLGEWPVKAQAGVAVLLALGVSVAAGVVVLRLGQEDLTQEEANTMGGMSPDNPGRDFWASCSSPWRGQARTLRCWLYPTRAR